MTKNKEGSPLIIILSALLCFFLVRSFVADFKRIAGHSMQPAVQSGEFVLINKLAYGLRLPFGDKYLVRWNSPVVGDIVYVRHPGEDKMIIKRCLGTRGDKLLITPHFLVIHSRTIPAGDNNLLETLQFSAVPDDKLLIIGDNYANSIDSRTFGFVPESSVLGKVYSLESGFLH